MRRYAPRGRRFNLGTIATVVAMLSLTGCLDILGPGGADVEVSAEPTHDDGLATIALVIENRSSDAVYLWNSTVLEVWDDGRWQPAYKGLVAAYLGIIAEIAPGERYESADAGPVPVGKYRYRARLSEGGYYERLLTLVSNTIVVSP